MAKQTVQGVVFEKRVKHVSKMAVFPFFFECQPQLRSSNSALLHVPSASSSNSIHLGARSVIEVNVGCIVYGPIALSFIDYG